MGMEVEGIALAVDAEYTHTMSMSKRLQIPISSTEERTFQSAAKIYNISTAEWARRILRKAAERDLSSDIKMTPIEAVEMIAQLNAPVDSVKAMKRQSIKGRFT